MAKFTLYDTTAALEQFCEIASECSFVTLDTEFIRDKTYYPKLCLLQMAVLSDKFDQVALFDILSPKLDLAPLGALLSNPKVIKVLHAARQDIEIFYQKLGIFPQSLFDTQLAARVCGWGHQISYGELTKGLLGRSPEQGSTLTDWGRRPLSKKQLEYAASDVSHLRDIYLQLEKLLEQSGRKSWINEEMVSLTNPTSYEANPEDAWQKIKGRQGTPIYQSAVYELAKLREQLAQEWNLPRQWVVRDDILRQIAHRMPKSNRDLNEFRFFNKSRQWEHVRKRILTALELARRDVSSNGERIAKKTRPTEKHSIDLLKVLLKMKSQDSGVAEQTIASVSDLREIAAGNPGAKPLSGWRKELFGKDALRLCSGEVALMVQQGKNQLISLPHPHPHDLQAQ